MFFKEKKRREQGRPSAAEGDPDNYLRLFGDKQPRDIPETSAWWKAQQKNVCAISDDAEAGMMQVMVTVTQNDSTPEMLAAVRRGPGARPEEHEKLEYLQGRKHNSQQRPVVEEFAMEHVLSYQRRLQQLKNEFMRRGLPSLRNGVLALAGGVRADAGLGEEPPSTHRLAVPTITALQFL